MFDERWREAFQQGEERKAAMWFREMLHRSVWLGLYEAMAEEVERLCGPRYKSDPDSSCQRAGSEKGVAYLDGGKDENRRLRVRHETEGEVQLATYAAVSNSPGTLRAGRGGGDPGASSARRGAGLGGCGERKSEVSRMWAESGFRKIRHAEDLPCLAAALTLSSSSSPPAGAGSSFCAASVSADQPETCQSTNR